MQKVGKDKVVTVNYRITDADGVLHEHNDLPVSYVHGGRSDLFEAVEAALDGLAVGARVAVTLQPEEGFGPHLAELTFTDDLDNVPEEFRHIGAVVEMTNDSDEQRTFVVSQIENGRLTVDGNHPLAGKTVTFDVTVRDVRDATDEEIQSGRVT